MPCNILNLRNLATVITGTALLSACGGGGSSTPPPDLPSTGTLSVGLIDAPVYDVTEVVVQFTGVTVKPAGGEAIPFDFDEPRNIDLLSLTNGQSADLLTNEQLEAGPYNWIRLNVNADDDGTFDSYVMTKDLNQQVELTVPSQQGLQLSSGFVITAGQSTNFIIDWDLNKGLVAPVGQNAWKLRPSLRITDLATFGDISGIVANALIDDAACTTNPEEDAGNTVYIFEGADITPDDIDDTDPDPIATAQVIMNENGGYDYIATYIPPGDYTVAFTCQALDDEPETSEDIVFSAMVNATVVDGEAFDAPLDVN